MEEQIVFDSVAIQAIIPHRYPFLMLDKVVEFKDNEYVIGVKNVTFNEPYFTGHFPTKPVMPGVMILEAMAQTAAILACKSSNGVAQGKTMYLVGVDEVKWRKQVVPGDQLRIKMESVKKRRPLWIMRGSCFVGETMVAQALISAVESD